MDACTTAGRRRTLAPGVEFAGISLAFDGEPVLDDVSLDVPAGRTTVLMGPSGVGKTTLIRTLLGLYTPDAGAVLVDGRAVGDLRPDELMTLRRGMGVLLGGQSVYESSLFGSLSVFDNVACALTAAGVGASEAAARTWRILHEFDLAESAERPPVELSAGERRRTALAKALVADPVLLVLDDPGPALDLLNRDEVVRTIDRHRRRTGATCVLVTHDIDVARTLGDHLAVLLDGEIVAAGEPAELLDGVHTADELDDRFGFRGRFSRAAPSETADAARRARRQGLVMAWLLMGVLIAITVALGTVLASGILDNPAT